MGQIKILFMLFGLLLAISGCVSIPNSPTPRYYALTVKNAGKEFKVPSGFIIGIGQVKIPEYLDRPQMVTETSSKMIQFAQFDRWGESLDLGLARLVREDLAKILPSAQLILYPWNPSIQVKYQVSMEVIQLDSELDGNMDFAVQWMIIDVTNSKTVEIKGFSIRRPVSPKDYAGFADALSVATASLSERIAQALASLKA